MESTSVLEALRAPNQQLFEQACLAAGIPFPDTPQASAVLAEACLRGAKVKADLVAKAMPQPAARSACLDAVAALCWFGGWHEFQTYAKRFRSMTPQEQRQRPESYRMTVAAWALSREQYEIPLVQAVHLHQVGVLLENLNFDEDAAYRTAERLLFRSGEEPTAENILMDEFIEAHEAGDVDRAAKFVISALATTMARPMVDSLVGMVNDRAVQQGQFPPSVTVMLRTATDKGFHEYAYNAASQLMATATTPKDYREAEAYFKVAMDDEANPAMQAAAHVNYCPIIRDGLISGKPDWPAAVEIYEKAARMGLVKGMFNAGNVCLWLSEKGDKAYGKRAAYWYKHAMEHRASGKPSPDKESAQGLEDTVYVNCLVNLSGMHIDATVEDADLEEGMRWARELADRGAPIGLNNLGVGRIRRLARLTTSPQNSPGAHWRAVLEQLDWKFAGGLETMTVLLSKSGKRRIETQVDHLSLEMADGTTMPLFVTHEACLPAHGGIEMVGFIAKALSKQHPERFFLVTRKAFFIEVNGRSCTPIYVMHKGELSVQAIWASGSPELVLEHAQDGVAFPDKRFSNWNCMIPIAVNALDEGFLVVDNTNFGQPYVSVPEPWRMPFVSKAKLLDVKIILEGYPGP